MSTLQTTNLLNLTWKRHQRDGITARAFGAEELDLPGHLLPPGLVHRFRARVQVFPRRHHSNEEEVPPGVDGVVVGQILVVVRYKAD